MKNDKADFIIPEDIKPLIAMVNSDGFEIYIKYLRHLRAMHIESILEIDPKKTEIVYTEHDLNRKTLNLIEDLLAAPIDALSGLWATVQHDEKTS